MGTKGGGSGGPGTPADYSYRIRCVGMYVVRNCILKT